MGEASVKETYFYCSKKNNIRSKELSLDSRNITSSVKYVLLIQSIFRGYLIRKDLYNYKKIKEVSIDYSTEHFETNPMIVQLNQLLPKFELTDKE